VKSSLCAIVLGFAACNSPARSSKPTTSTAAFKARSSSSAASTTAPSTRVAAFNVTPRPSLSSVQGAQTIDVRVRGVSVPGGSVLVSPSAVAITVDGHQVPAQLVPGQIDLGDTAQAWLVASFSLSPTATSVGITLTLAPQGSVEMNGQTVPLDLHGPPISFPADPTLLRTSDKVDIELNLTQSIVSWNGGELFLPNLMVAY
jgi:hypothetical protein